MKKIFLSFFILITCLRAQDSNKNWLTVFELSDSISTADYKSSIAYFQNLANESEFAQLKEIGVSPQGRKLYCLIVDKEMKFSPNTTEKPIVLIQNGIHSGEIEGKDASMLLLREILIEKNKEALIDNVVILVIPIFNVDGHERKSKYNRINQNGPEEMGWRTTAKNLNLNRDYTKADTPEIRALLKLFSEWEPDVFVDTHTTDGLDYQYTLTYGIEKHQNARKVLGEWARNEFTGYFENTLAKMGTFTSPYFSYLSEDYFSTDPREGVTDWVSPPRFSHGYAAYQNRIGILLETHMLKPYKERVIATKNALEVILDYVNNYPKKIKNLVMAADDEAITEFHINRKDLPISFESTNEFEEYLYKGYELKKYYSEITGSEITSYSDTPFEEIVKYFNRKKVIETVSVPSGYIIPREWANIIEVMKLHGIEIQKLKDKREIEVEVYKFTKVDFAKSSYEGRQQVEADYGSYIDTVMIEKGDYYISTNQRLVPLLVHLLEPKAPDSFFQWGFFNSILERKEYFEMYSMEPIAKKMADDYPELKKEYEQKLANDESLKDNPRARLNFFYERSPYFDNHYKVYPVLRVLNEL